MIQTPTQTWHPAVREVLLATGSSLLGMTLVLAGLRIAGFPAWDLLREWIVGALGSGSRIGATLRETCPLLITGLGIAWAFRAGSPNIGAEGQFILGAAALVACTTRWMPHGGGWALAAGLLMAMLAGGLWAVQAALMEHYRRVPLVLSTILLNFIGVYLVSLLLQGPLQAPGTQAPQSASLPEAAWLPQWRGLHSGIFLALALALLLWIWESRTRGGFENRVVGINPLAARLSGIRVWPRQRDAMMLSGALCGLAGGVQVAGVTHFMSESFGGFGYSGIAVALLGRLHPLGVALAALFFGALETGSRYAEKNPQLALPHDLANVIKGLILLTVLAAGAAGGKLRGDRR